MFFKNILNTFLVYLAIMCMIKLTLSQSCAGRYSPSYKGTCSKRTECTGALLNNLCSGDLVCCISEPNPVSNNFVTSNDLEKLTGLKNNRISSISRVLQSPTTNPTCSQKASFLSQLAHESANFMYGEELGNGTEVYFDKYENRIDLGNTEPGDGRKFRGRGFIQITGRANYARAGKDLSLDLVNDPEMAAFPSVAAKIAVWFWQNGAYVDLNTLADNTFYSYSIMTSKINGGLKRLKERTELLEKAIDLYKCSSLLKGKGETCSINQEQAECKPMCVKGLEGKPYCGCNGKTQAGLCKGPTNIKCCLEKCGNYMDLTFVLDSSGSINSGDFTKAKSFIRSIVSSLDIGATQTRVGIINYATSIELVTYLNSIYNKAQLLNKIDSIVQIDTSTYTGEALTKCKDIYSTQNGMRDSSEGVSKLIVVLTDGESNGSIEPGPVAKELQSKGITMISIGVGSSLNFQELIDIASPGRVLLIDDYTNVLNAFEDISQISCSQPAEIPSETAVIKVEKDSFRYFYYPIVYEQGKDVVNIKLNVVEGDADLFGSFTNQQPNDNEVIDEDSMARLANSKSINDLVLDLPTQLQDNVNVYIGVKGKADQNAFKLQVATANKLLNSAKRLSNFNLFFYLMIIFSIYAY